MSTRSGRIRISVPKKSPSRTRKDESPPWTPAKMEKSSPTARSPSRKSPSRKSRPRKSPSSKSPSRKSPSRKSATNFPARKSPNRKSATNFPARKSPSRTTKENIENSTSESPAGRPPIKFEARALLNKPEVLHSVKSRRTSYSIMDISSSVTQTEISIEKVNGVDTLNSDNGLKRRKAVELVALSSSSRLHDTTENIPDNQSSYSRSASKSISRSIDTFHDGDDSDEEFQRNCSRSLTRTLITPFKESIDNIMFSKWEFGGRLGSIALMLLIPSAVFAILISCTKPCSHMSLFDQTVYKNISSWYSTQATIAIIGQFILQAIFALVPIFGTKADIMNGTGKEYCFNAFFASILTLNVVFTLDFFKILDNDALLNEYFQLALISYCFAIVLSITLYVKSLKMDNSVLNSYINTRYKLYDFFVGREIHPYIKILNVKIWISRISNINTLILTVLIFKRGINIENIEIGSLTMDMGTNRDLLSRVQLKPTVLIYSLMQIIYILSFIMREYKITTTLFWQCEGMGYLQIVSSALYPFFFTTISKFVADADLSLPTNVLILASVLYAVGLLIMLISNNIKYKFRKNPLCPSLAHLDSMLTIHGNKLLTSNLWGIVRHPNYAGDMLVHIALGLPGVWTGQYLATAPAILTILALAYRARRDHYRCRNRYGAAWQKYCNRVPSVIFPNLL